MTPPPYLPTASFAAMTVDDRWSAVSAPLHWGYAVIGALGDAAGPAYANLGSDRIVWPLPPDGAADWPDTGEAGITRYGPGAQLLVPGPDGHVCLSWITYPLEGRPLTEPAALRQALETVVGPLEDAAARGPLVACSGCGRLAREAEAEVVAWHEQMSGPGWLEYACAPCHRAGPRPGRRAPEEPPR